MAGRFRLRATLLGACALGHFVIVHGCAPTVSAGDAPEPTSRGPSPTDTTSDVIDSDSSAAPFVKITSPDDGWSTPVAPGSTEGESKFTITGTASSGMGIASVSVSVGPNSPRLATSDDGFKTWRIDVEIPPGTFEIRAIAYDVQGRASPPNTVRVTRASAKQDEAAPSVTITSPPPGTEGLVVLVQGTTEDDIAVVKMEVYVDGLIQNEREVATDDFLAHWSRLVTLIPGQDNYVEFRAYDAAGNIGTASIVLVGKAELDRIAPSIVVTTPVEGSDIDTDTLHVVGTAADNLAVRDVRVRVGTGSGASAVFGDYVKATTTDGYAHWTADVAVTPLVSIVEARAVDVSGLATSTFVNVTNGFQPTWSAEREIPLRLPADGPAPTLTAVLDKAGVNQVLNTSIQRQTQILTLDPTNLLSNALVAIRDACGTDWKNDKDNPTYNCQLTALGQTFGTNWKSSAEFALVRLLTMTPRNVIVDGTSIARLSNLADALNIGGGFSSLLAETLGIGIREEIIKSESLVPVLRDRFMASHPYLSATGGSIPVTLYDAMNDLSPLGTALGPAGGHPGVLDPSLPPYSPVLGANFKMKFVAKSNLRWFDGVALPSGKEYLALVEDQTGPTYDDVLEFDFQDPTRFDIEGIVDSPVIDLKLRLKENTKYIETCTNSAGIDCIKNEQGKPQGTNFVWSTPIWELENIIASGALNQYRTRNNYSKTYWFIIPAAWIDVGAESDPAGWLSISTIASVGSPPRAQYLWELISEVAQKNLHSITGAPEGQVNPAFTLSNIPVGITAAEIRAKVGPELQKQRAELSSSLLGDYAKNNGNVDFFLKKGADGVRYLYFVAPSDPRPVTTYGYSNPGFFSDEAITQKISSKNIQGSGDSVHEKLALLPGEATVYTKDVEGKVYRLRLSVPASLSEEVKLRLSRKVQ